MQTPEDFLKKHHDAHMLIIDTETGLPARAEYLHLDPATLYPVTYYYPEY